MQDTSERKRCEPGFMAPAAPAAPQKQTSQFKLRAQARGLVLPDDDNGAAAQSGPVVWDGRAFVLAKGDERCAREAFTYCHGQRMVGQTEQPCASTTKLVAGRHRFVNAPDNSKEGYLWRPGNRYTHRVRTPRAPARHADRVAAQIKQCPAEQLREVPAFAEYILNKRLGSVLGCFGPKPPSYS